MVPNEYEADNSEYYYAGSLPVLAGRFRRKLVGYFNGNIPPGTRIGREIRLIKLPELTWVYGYLLRDAQYGVVVYVPDGASLASVEGFHPLRSGREIRQTQAVNTTQQPHLKNLPTPSAANLDDNLDDLTDVMEIGNLDGTPRP
jgi:hypothetical protein